jgi:hypothetical protein
MTIQSLQWHEELRQLEGICKCCESIKKGNELKLFISDEIRYIIIPAFCPVCGKKIIK